MIDSRCSYQNLSQLIYVMCLRTFLISNNSIPGKNEGWCLVLLSISAAAIPTIRQKAPVLCQAYHIIMSQFYSNPLRQVGIINPVIYKRKVELSVTHPRICKARIQIQMCLPKNHGLSSTLHLFLSEPVGLCWLSIRVCSRNSNLFKMANILCLYIAL